MHACVLHARDIIFCIHIIITLSLPTVKRFEVTNGNTTKKILEKGVVKTKKNAGKNLRF